jgi:TonB-linked SusC/RagA family outer membrane protein
MKLTTLLLIVTLMLLSFAGRAQITLKEKNAPLEKVLTDIEKQTKYVFLYDPDEVKIASITIEVNNASLQEALQKCFRGQPIEFTVIGNNVLLKRKSTGNRPPDFDVTIRGRVVDETGQPLVGVSIYNASEKKGTQTDTAGAYSLRGKKGDLVRFSFVGYKPREIRIGDQREIMVTLEVNPSDDDQVVVIAYGSSKKKDLTGAVSVVATQDLSETPYNTFDNALAGKVAGLDITKTDGTPGGMVRVRLRGTSSLLGGNDPLYVIDGVPVQVRNNFITPGFFISSPLADLSLDAGGSGVALQGYFINGLNSLGGLNLDDIESITVLKDASSTAIYGSKAANGVVIITTRTGKPNAPSRLNLDYYTTTSTSYRTPKLLNAAQYKMLLTEAAQNTAAEDSVWSYPIDPVTAAVLDSPSYFGNANTNWIKTVTRTTVSQNVGLRISGGGENSKYFTSLSYNNTPGVVDGTGFQRITGKFNLETQVLPKLKFSTNLILGSTNQDFQAGAYTQAVLARPDWTPRDASGNYTDFTNEGPDYDGFLNPAALLNATNNGKILSLLGSASATYAISKDLSARSTVALNMQDYNQRIFIPSYIDIDVASYNSPNPGGIGSDANSHFTDWFLENTLTWSKQFNARHSANLVIGQSYETTKYSYYQVTAAGFPNNTSLTSLSSADSVVNTTGDDPSSPQSYLLSFYARANYSYMDKYLATFTGRADGSSKFGPDNKFGYFPSGALAWRISKENFLKNVGWIDDLKLRTSYGLTGNQNIGDQMYRTLYGSVTYAGSNALIPVQLGNQGIKWETTNEADVGLDLALLNARLNATFDYYNRQTNDALFWQPVAASTSYATLLQNAVGLRNRGFEASVAGDIIRTRDLGWTASVNVTWRSSLVTKLNPLANPSQILGPTGFETISDSLTSEAGNTNLLKGKPLGLITGYVINGLVKTPAQLAAYNSQFPFSVFYALQVGYPSFETDSTQDGYTAPAYGQIIGYGAPKYFGGMTQELRYKRFDLQCYFTFSHGGHLLWVEKVASDGFDGVANADRAMLGRYTPTHTNTNQPVLSLNEDDQFATNIDIFSSSYFKLRSLTLNYRLEGAWMKRATVSDTQVFISATNVFTLTKYPGSDPETSDDPYSVNGGYFDVNNYPATRTFSIGFKTAF